VPLFDTPLRPTEVVAYTGAAVAATGLCEVFVVAYVAAAVTKTAASDVVAVAYAAAVTKTAASEVAAVVYTAAVAETALCEVVAVALAKTAASELVAAFCRAWSVRGSVVCLVAQYQHWMNLQPVLDSNKQHRLDIV